MAKTEETAEIVDTTDAQETRVYELGFHIDGELPSEEAKKTYQLLRAGIAEKGTIISEGEPLKIPLAYTISRGEQTGRRDFNTAFFCWIAYEANVTAHTAILESIGEQTRVFRFIDIKTTKEEAHHSAEMAELYAKMPMLEADHEAEVMDTEIDAALKEVEVA